MTSARMSHTSGASTRTQLIEGQTPRHTQLSGRYKQSFAYLTLNTRMPGIMQQICMRLFSESSDLQEKHGEEVKKDIQQIINAVDVLGTELGRDRNFTLFHGDVPDKLAWNAFIAELPVPKRCYFRACWLHAECYLYRRIYSFFENSRFLRGYDCFDHLKHEDLIISEEAMKALARATKGLAGNFDNFKKLLLINLWSNHFELQLSAYTFGEDEDPEDIDVLLHVAKIDRFLLVDDSINIWNCLLKRPRKDLDRQAVVDYICDNAGFELFTDFLLLAYMVENNLVHQVRLHLKAIPWYISDATAQDVEWTLKYLVQHQDKHLSALGRKFEKLITRNKIVIAPVSYFWTGPQSYFVMVEVDMLLYRLLTTSQLAIFKGDLNYRKLLGDFSWDSTEDFITCLRGFRPTNICAIRTVKCEVICGLAEGQADSLLRHNHNWMITGCYGQIQYTDSMKCSCGLVVKSHCDITTKSVVLGP